jgi:hypothetical protein
MLDSPFPWVAIIVPSLLVVRSFPPPQPCDGLISARSPYDRHTLRTAAGVLRLRQGPRAGADGAGGRLLAALAAGISNAAQVILILILMRNTRRAHILQREGLLHETLTRGHPSSIQSSHCATNMQWLCKLAATANPVHIKTQPAPPQLFHGASCTCRARHPYIT